MNAAYPALTRGPLSEDGYDAQQVIEYLTTGVMRDPAYPKQLRGPLATEAWTASQMMQMRQAACSTVCSNLLASPWLDRLAQELIRECERAMRQRDQFLKTGKSTAGHGGSHDTCFERIVRESLRPFMGS